MEWFKNAAFYHIYPLGYCGCPKENGYSECKENRLALIENNIEHIKSLGFNAVYFGPVFQSVRHGYDTVDYTKIDSRLGTNEDFARLCKKLHENGIKVVVDGVFNHVGRDFEKFVALRNGDQTYRDWFHVREGNTCYNDGFYYEAWEGHYELVKLNLYNPAVKEYIKECISGWVKEFDIDGIRLDVAYCLELNFLKELHGHCKWLKNDFWLMGETLHGDYNKWMNPEMLDSVTNYECYKGLYSSFNDYNLFEIAHSLNRQFGTENWCLYTGKLLYSFADNHDVSRLATILRDKKHLPLAYGLLFTMPGIPSVYYGSEYGIEGDKHNGDDVLRIKWNETEFKNNGLLDMTELVSKLAKLRTESKALANGSFKNLQLLNRQYSFIRECENEKVVTFINADANGFDFNSPNIYGSFTDILTGEQVDLCSNVHINGYDMKILVNSN